MFTFTWKVIWAIYPQLISAVSPDCMGRVPIERCKRSQTLSYGVYTMVFSFAWNECRRLGSGFMNREKSALASKGQRWICRKPEDERR